MSKNKIVEAGDRIKYTAVIGEPVRAKVLEVDREEGTALLDFNPKGSNNPHWMWLEFCEPID